MKFYSTFTVLFLILSVISCTSRSVGPGVLIDGYTSDSIFEGKTVILSTCDSVLNTVQVSGKRFSFKDTTNVTEPYMAKLSICMDSLGGRCYELPIVIENGEIKAHIGNWISISGTPLNDNLQEFLRGIDKFLEEAAQEALDDRNSLTEKFEDLVKKFIIINSDNPVGVYIYNLYAFKLSATVKAEILAQCPYVKEKVSSK